MTTAQNPLPDVAQEPSAQVPAKAFSQLQALGSLFGAGLREERFFLLLSVFIGIFSGLAVVCFRIAIEWSRLYLLGPEFTQSRLRLILSPTLAGLLVAVLVLHVFPTARGSGVNQTKAALYIFNGYISFRTSIGKFITSRSGHRLRAVARS